MDVTTALETPPVVLSDKDPEDLGHFYDPEDWPYAWCGKILSEEDDNLNEDWEVDCPSCLRIWFQEMMED